MMLIEGAQSARRKSRLDTAEVEDGATLTDQASHGEAIEHASSPNYASNVAHQSCPLKRATAR
ncbi:hypothetical protein [Variovorax sp. YR216]|uniref:hypothetical protein n=1 Tax=Variovorax sp. YR216 TaxID=1882828 RepID=UPI00089BE9E8|nr:hypothetical protein [Variovorax sp. YR216]SEB25791.1 hypothetical protein SAMN05444680_12752 [Variovorax sp. YR216]